MSDETTSLVPVQAVILDRPFSFDRRLVELDAGVSIADLLAHAGIPSSAHTLVWIGGVFVPAAWYPRVRVKAGASVLVRVVPRGGGRGAQRGKNIGSIVLGLVLIIVGAVSAFTTYGFGASWGVPMILAGASLMLSGIINLLLPMPKQPQLPGLSGVLSATSQPESPSLSISGGSNAARPYGVVPRILGRHRVFPAYGAMPFTEQVGADQYLRMLFVIGLGPTEISEMKIGETPIDNFSDVEVEVRFGYVNDPPLTLYTQDVNEQPLSIVLLQNLPQIRTSALEAVELSVDIIYPTGLVRFAEDGSKAAVTVQHMIDYRPVGSTTWTPAPGGSPLVITDARQNPVRSGLRWKPQQAARRYGASSWTQFGLASVTLAAINDGVLNVAAFNTTTSPAGAWLELDASAVVEFGRVVVTSSGIGENSNWSVQTSIDRVVWTTLATSFITGAAVSQSVEWPTARGRYWRLLKVNPPNPGPDYYEVQWEQPTGGQYDVRITRLTVDGGLTDPLVHDASVWGALRTVGSGPPVTLPGLAMVALRIKATDQLNGIIDNFNCLAQSRHLDYATYAGTVLADGPIGYWRLGEINGAPTAFDASGHAYAGTYAGDPALGTAGLVTGDNDTAMACDGFDDTVTVAELSAVDMGAMNFTVECAVGFLSVAAGTHGIVSKGDGAEFTTSGWGWSLIRAGNKLRFSRAIGGTVTVLESTSNMALDSIVHVVVTYDRSDGTARLWINGVVDAFATLSTAIYADSYQLKISAPSAAPFDGVLDEVAVYPKVLPGDRIAARYAAFTGLREWISQPTSNPASLYREVLQGTGNARPVLTDRLDLLALQLWHQECDSAQRSCNLVVDYKTTAYDVLKIVAACGRATPTMNDLKFSVVRDVAQVVPIQHFTPRNSRNFKGSRVIAEPFHAFKVRFVDPASGWQQVDRFVYDDGYSEANATRFESLELLGVTDPDHAWRLGRYHMACARLRPEAYEIETDVEYLACRRGDLVRVAHDVPEWGLAWGRIKAVAISGGHATGITLDETVTMSPTGTYAVRMRLADATSVVANILTDAAAPTATLTFESPLAEPLPAVGDLVMLGVRTRETIEAIVAMVRPGPDLSAVLTLVDAAPAVLTADQAPIPAWDPQMTKPILREQNPPTPLIVSVQSDESVLVRALDGSLSSRIVLTLEYLATSNVRADYLEARFRRSDSTGPFSIMPQLPPDTTTVSFTEVEDGVSYDLRVRTVNRDGAASVWAEVLGHIVVGKTTPPPPVTNLRLEEGTTTLKWDYPAPPPDLDAFEVRRSPGATGNWETAVEMHVGLVFAPFQLPTIYGQWTFLVSAVDTSGNASSPATLTIDFGDVRLHNQVATRDYDALGYPGTITNGTVSAGDLKADQVTTGFWTNDENRFWSPSGLTLFWQGTYKEMTYLFTYTTAATDGGSTLFFDTTVSAIAWQLFYRIGTSGDYVPWPGALPNLLASQEYDFRLVTDAGVVQGVVSRLTLYLDAEDLTEHQAAVATAVTTGTRLTLQHTFRTIKQVKPTVVASGVETAITAIAADKQNTAGANNGPLIKSYDQAGAVVAGHVDVDITGY